MTIPRVANVVFESLQFDQTPNIPWQVTTIASAGALLAAAQCIETLGIVNHGSPAGALRAAAATLTAIPVIGRGLFSLWEEDTESLSDILIALATCGAILSGEYLSAVLVPFVVEAGHWLEVRAQTGLANVKEEFERLANLPANVVEDDRERQVPARSLIPGQVVLVRPGEDLPTNGQILRGASEVDESRLTGESTPRAVFEGNEVLAGTRNLGGFLAVKVTGNGGENSWNAVAELFDDAVRTKPTERGMLDRLLAFALPLLAVACIATWLTTGNSRQVATLLIVACPCALALAFPAANLLGVISAARRDILVKQPRRLTRLAYPRTVILDKTGTVTTGELSVLATAPASGTTEAELLHIAHRCAIGSHHPVARAIIRFTRNGRTAGVTTMSAGPLADPGDRHREYAGDGIRWSSPEAECHLGRREWVEREGTPLPPAPQHPGPLVAVSQNRRFLGYLLLTDTVRPEATEVVRDLRSLGVQRIVLVSGDRRPVVEAIAAQLQLDAHFAEYSPQRKLAVVRSESLPGETTVVVGDGLNDALALAGGDVGVALASRGCSIATGSADMVLLSDSLASLVDAITVARQVRRVSRQNLTLAILAMAGLLIWVWSGSLSPVGGAVVHHVGAALVLLNSLGRLARPPLRPRGVWPRRQPGEQSPPVPVQTNQRTV